MEGLKERISARVGPLPAWAWVVVFIGAYLVYRFINRDNTSSDTTGQAAYSNPFMTTGGALTGATDTVTNAANTITLTPEQLAALIAAGNPAPSTQPLPKPNPNPKPQHKPKPSPRPKPNLVANKPKVSIKPKTRGGNRAINSNGPAVRLPSSNRASLYETNPASPNTAMRVLNMSADGTINGGYVPSQPMTTPRAVSTGTRFLLI